MKYVKVLLDNLAKWGVIEGDDIEILDGEPYCGLEKTGEKIKYCDAKLLPPCSEYAKIVAIGKNYYDHAIELGGSAPEYPIIFIKPATTLNCQNGDIEYPAISERVDYEAELALVIKKQAKHVKKEDAPEYILGYTCLNDITARDLQQLDGQWTRAKGFDGFAPIGPFVTDDIDPANVMVTSRLNGETKQNASSSLMMWDIPSLIEYVTSCMTLNPGDVLTTGTPAGIGPMKRGDIIEVEISDIGILRNRIV